MHIFLLVVKTIVGWALLMFVSTNLVGFVVRGFFPNPEIARIIKKEERSSPLRKEAQGLAYANIAITILFVVISIFFLYALNRYINIWALIAALMLMISRIPDLLWEICYGREKALKHPPTGGIYFITTLIDWAALPVVFWALYS